MDPATQVLQVQLNATNLGGRKILVTIPRTLFKPLVVADGKLHIFMIQSTLGKDTVS